MKKYLMLLCSFFLSFFFSISFLSADDSWDTIVKTGELKWGADPNGGAPFVFYDANNPDKIIGFEVEIMDAVARKLNVRHKVVVVPWDQLVPALLRKDYDLVLNGLEVTNDRMESINFTIPYYIFSEQITVRQGDTRFKKFEDLRGYKVGALSATLAQRIMEQDGKIFAVPYPSPVEVYKDLEIGRIDAALQDFPIAAWYIPQNQKLQNIGQPIGEALYAGAVRKDSLRLNQKINEALHELITTGELEVIYRKWNMWSPVQKKLKSMAEKEIESSGRKISIKKYIPILIKGAGVTIMLSSMSMLLAVMLGFTLCIGKLYGSKFVRAICNIYIEIIRGTPLLIQLYLLYYGLPNVGIKLNAFVAAFLGMGMNYAAYEAEIYRAGLLSVPKGQDEAARSLGMTGKQSLWYIILPQAVRTILPPSTNDFIALFKDTSLVSIITVTELTRAYSQAATTTYRFLELGLLTAALYFIMSFPLSLWSRSMEKKRHVAMH